MSIDGTRQIYLREVQNNPQPCHYLSLIRTSQESGREVCDIWYLFAYRPAMTQHLQNFTQEVMRGESPLSVGLRELIAAYTSYLNECEFCTKAHAAVAAELLGSEELVWAALRDPEQADLKDEEKALLRFVRQITKDLSGISEKDVQAVRDAGWSDEAIFYAITVCALFNLYNRWVGASGVHAISDEGHRFYGRSMALRGYDPKAREEYVTGFRSEGGGRS